MNVLIKTDLPIRELFKLTLYTRFTEHMEMHIGTRTSRLILTQYGFFSYTPPVIPNIPHRGV